MQKPTDQAETSIPVETVVAINNLILNRIFTVRRKAAKRSEPWYLEPPENIAAPLSIPARKKPRLEEPLPTTTDEAAKKTAPPDLPEGLPPPATPPPCNATVNVSSRRQSRRQARTPLIETSETQPDDANAADDGDLSGRTPHLAATVNAPTSRRSSRRVIPTSSTGTPKKKLSFSARRFPSNREILQTNMRELGRGWLNFRTESKYYCMASFRFLPVWFRHLQSPFFLFFIARITASTAVRRFGSFWNISL